MKLLNRVERLAANIKYGVLGRSEAARASRELTVSVCLITCERYEYTRRTVESFARLNDISRFKLLHADDASEDERICAVANEFGFETVCRPAKRQGNMATIRGAVAAADTNWVVILENDWESARPFPWHSLQEIAARPAIFCLRLCGAFRDQIGTAFSPLHVGRNKALANWQPLGSELEVASIHWGNLPAVTRAPELHWLLAGAGREKEVSLRSGKLDLLTARVKDNVFNDIGTLRTPEFQR
jgi:hypothetical protein